MTVSGAMSTEPAPAVAPASDGIQEVWQCNLEQEFKNIRKVIKKYNYVAMVIPVLTSLRCDLLFIINFVLETQYSKKEYWNAIGNASVFCQDTEFPGVVARPIGQFTSQADYQYQNIRCNVDLLKLIQVHASFLCIFPRQRQMFDLFTQL